MGGSPEGGQNQMFKDEHQAECNDDCEYVLACNWSEYPPFYEKPQEADHNWCDSQGKPETPEITNDIPTDNRSEHIKGAVSDVDHFEEAKDKTQAQGDEGDDQSPDEAIYSLKSNES